MASFRIPLVTTCEWSYSISEIHLSVSRFCDLIDWLPRIRIYSRESFLFFIRWSSFFLSSVNFVFYEGNSNNILFIWQSLLLCCFPSNLLRFYSVWVEMWCLIFVISRHLKSVKAFIALKLDHIGFHER